MDGTFEQNEYRKNLKQILHYQPRGQRSTGCTMRTWDKNMRL